MDSPDQYAAASSVKTVPAPIGGINAKDGLASMPETDAVDLLNWIPDTGGLRCRKGFSEWAINVPGDLPVKSIVPFFNQSTSFPGGSFLVTPTSMPGTLFAATDDDILDITSATNAPASALALSGATNAGWLSSVMLTNSAGTSFLLVCSETDGYFTYDGATWVTVTAGGGATQVSGVDPADFVFVATWKRRAWFVEKDSSRAWYLPVDSLYGAASKFDFGPMFKKGGSLSYLANWTIDAGEGIDDFLVAVSSNGEVVVYKGTDPASISTMALVGTWFVGQIPVGRRGCTQFGGDLVIVSADGVFPISYVTRGGADFLIASASEYSSYIRPLLGQDIRASFTELGWQMIIHPSERLMVVNVPYYSAVQEKQFAMSTSNNRWTVFSGMPILSLGFIAGYMFAGTPDGRVLLLFNGFFDDVAYGESTGNSIPGVVVPAFSYFGVPAVEKEFLLIRPVFLSQLQPEVQCDIAVNFKVTQPTGSAALPSSGESLWGSAVWGVSLWSGSSNVYDEWYSAGDTGYCGAAVIKTRCTGDTLLTSIDYCLQTGSIAG
jgi:hypothetical protein